MRIDCTNSPGLLIYLKASLLAPNRAPKNWGHQESRSYNYKTYHATFPHESTANQFFDEDQWEAYYQLGRRMAAVLLGVNISDTDKEPTDCGIRKIKKIKELVEKFENLADKEALDEKKQEEEEANLIS